MFNRFLIGVFFLVILLGIFFISQQPVKQPQSKSSQQKTTQTTLSLLPNPLVLPSTATEKINIVLDTGENAVSFVQVKLTYNPEFLPSMHIEKGPFFAHATVLFEHIDTKTGTITYMLSIPKSEKEIKGKGVIATLSFTNTMKPRDVTPIRFSKDTLVTNNESPNSLLGKTIDTTILRNNTK